MLAEGFGWKGKGEFREFVLVLVSQPKLVRFGGFGICSSGRHAGRHLPALKFAGPGVPGYVTDFLPRMFGTMCETHTSGELVCVPRSTVKLV